MNKSRLEAFSDGVIAILITIMVLGLKVPHRTDAGALRPLLPLFVCYVLSFVYLGIYWNNHHHLLQAIRQVNGRILWANLHLLFWLSLLPFVTGWMGENEFAPLPVALYGVVLMLAAVAYYVLTLALVALHGRESALAAAVTCRRQRKTPQAEACGVFARQRLRKRRPDPCRTAPSGTRSRSRSVVRRSHTCRPGTPSAPRCSSARP